jgi:hypothetical protein
MAIGPGAKHADDETDDSGNNAYANGSTATAIGYSSKAYGTGALSIGAGISGTGEKNLASNSYAVAIGGAAQATASSSIAIGFRAKAVATGSVQLGTGTNDEPDTLKFKNTTIVKNGKLCGFDDTSLDPKEIDVSDMVANLTDANFVYPHVMNTLYSTNACRPGTELAMEPSGSRNYEIYIPNEPEFASGMPIIVEPELPSGMRMLYIGKKSVISRLPAVVKIQQPTRKNVLVTVNELDDETTDWTPVITNSFIRFDSIEGKFYCATNRAIEGINLHIATEFKIVYPSEGGSIVTNDYAVAEVDSRISGTFYGYATSRDFVPLSPVSINDSQTVKTWYEIIYKTVNGEAEVFHQDLTSIVKE